MYLKTFLDHGWSMAQEVAGKGPDSLSWQKAFVPGTVASSLQLTTEDERELSQEVWWYQTTITAPQFNPGEKINLVFEGLASFCDIFINDRHVLKTENMFLKYVIELKEEYLLAGKELQIKVRFNSLASQLLIKRPRAKWKATLSVDSNMRFLRTSLIGSIQPWTNKIIPVGIYRDVYLEVKKDFELKSFLLSPHVKQRKAYVKIAGEIEKYSSVKVESGHLLINDVKYPFQITGQRISDVELAISDVEMWQVHTHGSAHLVKCEVYLLVDGKEKLVATRKLGFRECDFSMDENSAELLLNGKKIFCRGFVHTILDSVSFQNNEESLRALLKNCQAAGVNMIRVGGTMTYESDLFYDLCDEMGILVWQDFMFANMDYPFANAEFLGNVLQEISYQLERLSNHPSVLFFSGGSEVYQQAAMLGISEEFWKNDFYEKSLADLTKKYITDAIYFPSSPCYGALPFHVSSGIAHYYGVGAYNQSLDTVKHARVKLATECLGFSNLPTSSGLEAMYRGKKIEEIIKDKYAPAWIAGLPKDNGASWDFEDTRDYYLQEIFKIKASEIRQADTQRYFHLSQIVPGEVMKYVYSFWRNGRSGCAGALVWFLKDFRFGAGFGLVDAFNRPKPSFYYLKRSWSSLNLSLSDDGLDGLQLTLNNEKELIINGFLGIESYNKGKIKVFSHEEKVDLQGETVRIFNSDQFFGFFTDITYSYKFGEPKHDVVYSYYKNSVDGSIIAEDFYFPSLATLEFEKISELKANLKRIDENTLELSLLSKCFFQNVFFDDVKLNPEDNYFHLAPNREKKILIEDLGKGKVSVVLELSALNAKEKLKVSE